MACVLLLSCVPAQAASPYASGEVAAADAYSPMGFRVVDVEATVALLAQSGEQAPVAIRHDANLADGAVAQLTEAFRKTRETFLTDLEKTFGERIVGSREINSAAFRNFRNEFQTANPRFPINLVLAQTWAKGYDGEPTLARLSAALRRILESRLIGDVRPASTVFLVSIGADERARHWGEISRLARTVELSEIISVEEAGLELRRLLDALDRVAGGFLSGLIQPNVAEDRHLTGLLFDERLGDRAVRLIVREGELLARQGATVDHRAALALNHLQRAGLAPLGRPPAPPVTVVDAASSSESPAPVGEQARSWTSAQTTMIVGAFLGAALLAGAIAIGVRSRRRRLEAEVVAVRSDGRPTANLKEALLPHLARELKDKLVHVLFAQRHELLHNEEEASRRVAEMEERLSRLQPAIAERIRSYEQRIESLERQLEEKDQETRDLIRAKLVLARKELDEEITRTRIKWN